MFSEILGTNGFIFFFMDKILRSELDWVTLSGVLYTWKEVTKGKYFKTNNLIQKTWAYVIDCLFLKKRIHFLLTPYFYRQVISVKSGRTRHYRTPLEMYSSIRVCFSPAFPAFNANFVQRSHTLCGSHSHYRTDPSSSPLIWRSSAMYCIWHCTFIELWRISSAFKNTICESGDQ